jgi:hypothetical protein
MLRTLSVVSVIGGLFLAGSACTVQGQVRTRAYVAAPEAELVLVRPGLYVVADYDQPVFYTDGYYWLYRDGFWLRSYTYTGGWSRVRGVPHHVRRINRPQAYVRYRARGNVNVYRAPARRGEAVRRVDRRNRRDDRRDDRVERRRDRREDKRDHRRDRRDRRDNDRRR